MSESPKFSYSIEPVSSGVELVARGDLDGDGETSRFVIHCRSDCECDESPTPTRPLE
jgi:hypothetical protein